MIYAHLARPHADGDVVCFAGKAAMFMVIGSPDLLNSKQPCPKCLEWVVEQGQMAARRLLLDHSIEPTGEEQ